MKLTTSTFSWLKLYITLSLIGIVSVVFAQKENQLPKLRVEQFSIDNGLSQNTVNTILQDSKGYIWVGTDDGLNRYNAYDFTIFRHNREDSLSIIDNQVQALYEDRNGNIWIGTISGISVFDRNTQKFTSFYNKEGDSSSLVDNQINTIVEDKEGYIWIGTEKGLSKFDYSDSTFFNYIVEKQDSITLGNNKINKLLVDEQNRLIIGTEDGLNIWTSDRKPEHLYRYYNNDDTLSLWGDKIADLLISKDGTLWIATQGCLNRYNSQTNDFERFPDNSSKVRFYALESIIEMSNGDIWAINKGIIRQINLQTKEIVKFQTSLEITETTRMMIRSNDGIIWIGSRDMGLVKYDPLISQFRYYYHEKGNDNSLADRNVWSINKDQNGIVWVATGNGLSRIEREGKVNNYYNIKGGTKPIDIRWESISDVLTTREGDLIVGAGTDLYKLESFSNEKGAKFIPFERESREDTTKLIGQVLSIMQDSKGDIWIPTFQGLSKLIPTTQNKFGYYAQHYLKGYAGWSIYEDKQGTLWVGTDKGLVKVIRDENNLPVDFQYYTHDPENLKSVSHNSIRAINEDSKGNFWIGTTNGLNVMNRQTGEFQHWGERNKWANFAIYGILVDEKDNLWISTNNGIMKLLGDESIDDAKRIVNYNAKDGLQSSEFNSGAFFKAEDGEMFFGGIMGVTSFYPNEIKASLYVPSVVMTDFKILNRSVGIRSANNPDSPLEKDISQTKEITLNYEDKVVTFEFAALNFRRPEKTNYSYILEGFEKEWNEVGNRRFATYSNLPAGTYTFRVKAANSDGIENNEEVAIQIRVLPPWWKTWWFITSVFLSVVGLSFAFYRNRMNAIKRQNERLEGLVNERTAEIAQQNKLLETQKVQIERSYDNIRVLSEIGQKITSILDLDSVISAVYAYVNQLTDATAFGIGIYNPEKERIEFRGFIEDGKRIPDSYDDITDQNRLSVVCLTRNEDIIINNFVEEHTRYIKKVLVAKEGDNYQSIIYLPLLLEGKIVGVLTVQSRKTNAYSKNDLTILRTLASYISIALDNARTYTQLEGANEVIKSKNQSIMDSIRYGETIQHAILPDPQDFIRSFQDHFIIFKPQAVVSGDFYWSLRAHGKTFVAVVDCTGHGVPGAFMSMIGNTLLNEIVTLQNITEPAQILEHLNKGIWESLHQEDYQNMDGMDVCLCVIDDADDLNMRIVNFAGAKRPLFIFKNDKLLEVKGSRKSIGGRQKGESDYEQRQLLLHTGDILYLTTDGYVDQNDHNRIKYGTLRFKKVLTSIAHQDLHEQKEVLLEEMRLHMGEEEQRDDITLIGIKI